MSQPVFHSLALYKYKVLTGVDSIRLLQIERPSHTSDAISCLLTEHNVDDHPPKYAALSYVWGISRSPKPILLNNHRVHVMTNLYDALIQIRATFPGLLLRIDDICIDQRDSQERNQQEAMMRNIYSRATHTIAWLQPAS
ncbi:heterokaryon incompatibility protein-domain-containing protein [Boeremia exigua]|uniref:heterokaryon incompatibility protein-domain-containing protein n=1 Tax=Boeremia exigua TaxID=749465 RepID=UPI001E8CA6B6|nr:heterokaryon incompatibility protein-domain-containing protein [Boeremia exigua]KAH6612965.1 heterokaryon incompatibility protein-domain-containing protein [Boeremia exigua]